MEITEVEARYPADSTTAISFVAYDKSTDVKRPVVLIIPEWWGLGDYVKMRARELAKLGYFAMAVDMYGEGQTAETPDVAGKLAGPFYSNDQLAKSRMVAAINQIRNYKQADNDQVAMIGYCFGGAMALRAAKMALPLKGVVSFHGNLAGSANNNMPMLVCHGEDDQFVKPEEVAAWRKTMDSLGANYTFRSYPGATHAFTNPMATERGEKYKIPIAYNAAADTASWNEMKMFFAKIFR